MVQFGIRLGITLSAYLLLVHSSLATPIILDYAVVETVTNSATFDTIATDDPLQNYSEDGIIISTDALAYEGVKNVFEFGQTAYNLYYGNWSESLWVTISMADSSRINGLEFLIGDGFGYVNEWSKDNTYLIWETFSDGMSSGFGGKEVKRGSVVGWLDNEGFDSIRVAASYLQLSGFGQGPQAIGIDNVNIYAPGHSVPEPTTLLLLTTGFVCLVRFGSRKRQQQ